MIQLPLILYLTPALEFHHVHPFASPDTSDVSGVKKFIHPKQRASSAWSVFGSSVLSGKACKCGADPSRRISCYNIWSVILYVQYVICIHTQSNDFSMLLVRKMPQHDPRPSAVEIHHLWNPLILKNLKICAPPTRFHKQDIVTNIATSIGCTTPKKHKQKSMNLMSLKISCRFSGPRIPSNWHPSQPLLQALLAWLSGSASSKAKPCEGRFHPIILQTIKQINLGLVVFIVLVQQPDTLIRWRDMKSIFRFFSSSVVLKPNTLAS